MKNNLLDTRTSNLNELLGNGRIYKVPLYQRDYSWEIENWEDLWEDIVQIEAETQPHYMGAIVLQNSESKTFTVIDGQQRLATLSIVALACIQQINKLIDQGIEVSENQERKELLMKQYLGTKDPASLRYSSKLFLNENNDAFYQANLLQFRAPINPRKLKDSGRLLWQAFEFFDKKLEEKFPAKKNNGEAIAKFLNEVVAEKLVFIQINVNDELSAYTVFETLNSRGVNLTSTDLLKNFLFSKVQTSPTELEHAKYQWQKMIDLIGLNEFPAFLRHYINSTEAIVTKDKIFKRLKKNVHTAQDVFNLLDKLEELAYLYQVLEKPSDEFWEDYGNTQAREFVRELQLFKVSQYKSLVMAAYKVFKKPADFAKVLKICSVISFRYSVIGRGNANDLEKSYNKAAVKLYKGEISSLSALFKELRSVYIEDEDFKNTFQTKVINSRSYKKLIRYILVKLENHLSGKDIDFEETNATIEHILPESYPEGSWQESFHDEEHQNLLNRLGNLTLLENSLNKSLADKSFEEKKVFYAQSKYKLTQEITQDEWNPNTLKNRQEKLAKIAKGVWKLDE